MAGRAESEGQGGRKDSQRERGCGDRGEYRGRREIIGMDVGTSEDGAFWLAFLRSLSARGLSGVDLVISDAHRGLTDAIATVFAGASWQRCRHFMTNLLTRVPRSAQPWVATIGAHAVVCRRGAREGCRANRFPHPRCWAEPTYWRSPASPALTGSRCGPTIPRSSEQGDQAAD